MRSFRAGNDLAVGEDSVPRNVIEMPVAEDDADIAHTTGFERPPDRAGMRERQMRVVDDGRRTINDRIAADTERIAPIVEPIGLARMIPPPRNAAVVEAEQISAQLQHRHRRSLGLHGPHSILDRVNRANLGQLSFLTLQMRVEERPEFTDRRDWIEILENHGASENAVQIGRDKTRRLVHIDVAEIAARNSRSKRRPQYIALIDVEPPDRFIDSNIALRCLGVVDGNLDELRYRLVLFDVVIEPTVNDVSWMLQALARDAKLFEGALDREGDGAAK